MYQACIEPFIDIVNHVDAMQSHNLPEPFLMGLDKLFQQPPNRNMQQSTRTDYCKVATLRAVTKSLITCNERLSSAEHCTAELNEGFN